MADQNYQVNSGFYNSVNHDRLYDADDMNRPYKNILTEGIFPVEDRTTGGFAITPSNMTLTVGTGGGLFAGKWLESDEATVIAVPNNASQYARIDSVLIQIDTNSRYGYIVYRPGTPASTPVEPAINQQAGAYEFRLYNVRVGAGATIIKPIDITDVRPWAHALIYEQSESANFTVSAGAGFDDGVSGLVANGKVVFFSITTSEASGLELSFPAGFEPSPLLADFNIFFLGENGIVQFERGLTWRVTCEDGTYSASGVYIRE